MKIIIQSCQWYRHETEKIRRIIYTSFSTYNYKKSDSTLREKMEKFYGPNISISLLRRRFLKSEILLIAKINKKIVWVIRGKKTYIRNLYIHPNMLGYWIWSRLLKEFEHRAKNRGAKTILLKSSEYATSFYIKHWFTQKNEKFFQKNI